MCLGLAVSAGCVLDDEDADSSLSETDQGLYEQNGTQLWPWFQPIPICFAYSGGGTTLPVADRAAVTAFVKERISLTWGAILPLQFTWRDCPTSGETTDVLLDLSRQDNAGMCSMAGKGLLTTPAQRAGDITNAVGCHVSFTDDWNANQDRMLYHQRLLLHEFGHLLGFAHEFNRPDSADQPCGVPDTSGNGTLLTASYDPDSIMLSTYGCRSPDQYWLSPGDFAGSRSIYGTRVPASSSKDIVWQSTDGNVALWRMNGTVRSGEYFVPNSVGSGWTVLGGGDFDGDGIGDLLWRYGDGTVSLWIMNADGSPRSTKQYPLSFDWQFQAVSRFNNDRKSDVLWRNTRDGTLAMWMMNGTTIQYPRYIAASDQSWQVKAAGDFNRDGMADLFWRHPSGGTAVWLLNDGTFVNQAQFGSVDASWKLSTSGDFNGDGRVDLFWHNASTATVIWFMNGLAAPSKGSPGAIGTDWQAVTSGDFDADGKSDLVWRNTNGSNRMWIMDAEHIRLNLPLPDASGPWGTKGTLAGLMDPIE
ncbi:MAG: FG-GAP-like repeat-containing protein [Kofleriaceae bacterium]